MKGMNKLSRKQTAAKVRRILNLLPSREMIVERFVAFDVKGLQPGDCRFCAKGAVETFHGDRRLVKNEQGFYDGMAFAYTTDPAYKRYDYEVLGEIEDAMFDADKGVLEDTPQGRRKLFRVALAKCAQIAAE